MQVVLSIILIILSIVLSVLVLVQSKGADLGGFLGGGSGDGGVKRTRRGVELIMHRFTMVIAAVFFLVVLISFFVMGNA